MGNHNVGRAMAAGARGFWIGNGDAPVTKDRALQALDAIGEDFRGSDAEFDDEMHGDTELVRLVAIAFEATPEEMSAINDEDPDEDAWDRWNDGPYRRFGDHFGFC